MAAYITKPQLAKLHVLLSQLDLMDDKKEFIQAYTKGRTDSSREMYLGEARELIETLAKMHPAEKEKKVIWYLACKAGIIYGEREEREIDKAKLDMFLNGRGVVKKPLQQMTLPELKQVHKQFEGILRNNKRAADNKQAKKAVHQLLTELNITVK